MYVNEELQKASRLLFEGDTVNASAIALVQIAYSLQAIAEDMVNR